MQYEFLNEVARLTVKGIFFVGYGIMYYASTIPIFAFMSIVQERKIWKETPTPLSPYGMFKVFIFNVLWMVLIGLGALSLVPMWIARGMGSSVSLEQNVIVEKYVAIGLRKLLLGDVRVVNEHNIPDIQLFNVNPSSSSSPAPIFVANHCSQIDLSVMYDICKRCKWISKSSVKYLPGVGFGMTLASHIFIKRTGKNGKSVSNLFEQSNKAIQDGIPMVIFPQGTRRFTTKLPFKHGAFKIATENETKIVPVSIDIPVNIWNNKYPLNMFSGEKGDGKDTVITLTVHEPIQTQKDTDRAELMTKCQDVIYSVLPPIYHGEKSNDSGNSSSNNSGPDKKKD